MVGGGIFGKGRAAEFCRLLQKPSPLRSAVLGAVAAYYGVGGSCPALLGILLVIAALLAFFRSAAALPGGRVFRRPAVALIALGTGLALGAAARSAAGNGGRLWFALPRVEVLRGILEDDPRATGGGRGVGRLTLRSVSGRGISASARGRVAVYFPEEALPRVKEFGRASEIYVELSAFDGGPISAAGGNSGSGKAYGARAAPPRFRARSVHVIRPAPPLERFRTELRAALLERFSKTPWGGLAGALLLGVRDTLDLALAEEYNKAGCAHILALSGMHLAVLSSIIALFLRRPLGLKAAAATGAFFIIFYVFLVGPLPSLYRAALMYVLAVLVVWGILPGHQLLGTAFLLQLSIQGGDSLSFILSYLALFGIHCFGGPLQRLLRGCLPQGLLRGLAPSLGAFIATQTVVILYFGTLRPVGIAAGLALVPLITLFMILSLGWLALDLLFPFLSASAALIPAALYRFLEGLVGFASRAPGINAPPGLIAILTLVLGAGILLWEKRRTALREFLAPFN
jgi:competence protein ComEC